MKRKQGHKQPYFGSCWVGFEVCKRVTRRGGMDFRKFDNFRGVEVLFEGHIDLCAFSRFVLVAFTYLG